MPPTVQESFGNKEFFMENISIIRNHHYLGCHSEQYYCRKNYIKNQVSFPEDKTQALQFPCQMQDYHLLINILQGSQGISVWARFMDMHHMDGGEMSILTKETTEQTKCYLWGPKTDKFT